jgi:hypothetical protein
MILFVCLFSIILISKIFPQFNFRCRHASDVRRQALQGPQPDLPSLPRYLTNRPRPGTGITIKHIITPIVFLLLASFG